MTTDTYFKISVIDGALEIIKHQQKYNITDCTDAVRHLRLGLSHTAQLDYDTALEFAALVGWDAFQPSADRAFELRNTLLSLIRRSRPLWAQASLYGRERARRMLGEDQAQCLRIAGLLDLDLTEESRYWWDSVATFFRTLQDEHNLQIGRRGEELTLGYETDRLDKLGIEREVKWVAVEDNSAGYDVLSYEVDSIGEIHELKIEVKTTTLDQLSFIITSTEWETALRDPMWHRFYIWQLKEIQLIVLTVEEVIQHVPENKGHGKWQTTKIVL